MPATAIRQTSTFSLSLARNAEDLRAVQRLRYDVFVRELGGDGPLVDHAKGLERDRFDTFADHLILRDTARGQVIGAYRLMRRAHAQAAGGFYSASEYDLTPFERVTRPVLELGRSCVHPDYRDGQALHSLWSGLASYVQTHDIGVLFGVASFRGTDVTKLAGPLSFLHHRHLAPAPLRLRAHAGQKMHLLDETCIDRVAAMREMPALIKAYLRLGGVVGEGAHVDHDFNTTDVCMILDMDRINTRLARLFVPVPLA